MGWLFGPRSCSKRRKIGGEDIYTSNTATTNGTLISEASGVSSNVLAKTQVIPPKLDNGSIPKLIMMLQAEDPDQVVQALGALFDIFGGDEDVEREKQRKKAVELGVPTLLVLTMHKFILHETIQGLCCNCLASLTFETRSARTAFLSVGGVEAVVTAVQIFPSSIEVRDSGFGAMMNALSCEDGEEELSQLTVKVSTRFVEELGGLRLIQKAMNDFPEVGSMQGSCCGLLCNLATQKSFHDAIVKSGVIVTVGRALQNHLKDEKVRQGATGFMKGMCVDERGQLGKTA